MNKKRFFAILALCLLLLLCVGVFVEDTYAQEAKRLEEEAKRLMRLKMGVAFGSCFVLWAVIRYL